MAYSDTTIDVRGTRIRLLRGGTGMPVLYLHDTFRTTWGPFHDRLAEHCEVIFPVHPGCEGSEGFESIDDMQDVIFHYLEVCKTLGVSRPVLLGASLGGWIAAEWAVRSPDMLRGLILLDAFGLRVADAPALDLLRLDPAQTRAALFANAASPLARETVPDVPDAEALPGLLRARQFLARFAWQFPDNPKLARYLYRIEVPTLVLWGEQDAVVPLAHARAYAQGIARARLEVLPGCGHVPHIEQADTCAGVVQRFLATLS